MSKCNVYSGWIILRRNSEEIFEAWGPFPTEDIAFRFLDVKKPEITDGYLDILPVKVPVVLTEWK